MAAEKSGKPVLVVGSGPSGLSAAYHLKRFGHDVTIHEAEAKPGGMMRFGIPQYRLPRTVLDAEITRIENVGVKFELSKRIDNLSFALAEGHFDAVFLAIGAHISKRSYIPAGDASKVSDALQLLHDVETGTAPQLGRHVVVYGGGDTALDVARTAKRLGVTDALVIYRRTRDKMPARESEVQEALDEGIRIRRLSTIRTYGARDVLVEKMKLDSSGVPQTTGELETIA